MRSTIRGLTMLMPTSGRVTVRTESPKRGTQVYPDVTQASLERISRLIRFNATSCSANYTKQVAYTRVYFEQMGKKYG